MRTQLLSQFDAFRVARHSRERTISREEIASELETIANGLVAALVDMNTERDDPADVMFKAYIAAVSL